MTHRLLDFDWTVNEIVSSSMCDNHQDLASLKSNTTNNTAAVETTTTNESNNNGIMNDDQTLATASLREPLTKVLRLELMMMKKFSSVPTIAEGDAEENSKNLSEEKKQLLLELSKKEVDQLIESLQQALSQGE